MAPHAGQKPAGIVRVVSANGVGDCLTSGIGGAGAVVGAGADAALPLAAGCPSALTLKYLLMIAPLVPQTVPVLIISSAIAMSGGLLVAMVISWFIAKMPPQTIRYRMEFWLITLLSFVKTRVVLAQNTPMPMPAVAKINHNHAGGS